MHFVMRDFIILAASAAMLCACGPSRQATTVYVADQGAAADEEINVGYGSVSKDELTYSVNQVEIDEKEATVYSNIWDYMRGRVPGVNIGPAGAGETPQITVRGISSVNLSIQPLILVDGIETADISMLNPNDVASVSVLKDASAAIYGTRGANGVIMITTKTAQETARREAAAKKAARQAQKEARQARRAGKK